MSTLLQRLSGCNTVYCSRVVGSYLKATVGPPTWLEREGLTVWISVNASRFYTFSFNRDGLQILGSLCVIYLHHALFSNRLSKFFGPV